MGLLQIDIPDIGKTCPLDRSRYSEVEVRWWLELVKEFLRKREFHDIDHRAEHALCMKLGRDLGACNHFLQRLIISNCLCITNAEDVISAIA